MVNESLNCKLQIIAHKCDKITFLVVQVLIFSSIHYFTAHNLMIEFSLKQSVFFLNSTHGFSTNFSFSIFNVIIFHNALYVFEVTLTRMFFHSMDTFKAFFYCNNQKLRCCNIQSFHWPIMMPMQYCTQQLKLIMEVQAKVFSFTFLWEIAHSWTFQHILWDEFVNLKSQNLSRKYDT